VSAGKGGRDRRVTCNVKRETKEEMMAFSASERAGKEYKHFQKREMMGGRRRNGKKALRFDHQICN